jgi:ABC-type polysaccharide/polyol phosphate export permease
LFPLSVFIFTNLALRRLPEIGIYDIEFDIWIYPSMIFLVAGLSILPSIFRDVFDLRIHKKVIPYLSLSPHSKRYVIFSFSILSLVESLIFGLVSVVLYSIIIPFPFTIFKSFGLLIYFIIYIFLLSNIYIFISALSDKLSTILFSLFAFIFFMLFGSGLIISPTFYPISMGKALSLFPLVMLIQAMQSFIFSGIINWISTVIPLLTSLLLLILNSILIRNKLRQ